VHKQEIRELICSMLLGDGYLYEKNGTFGIEHSQNQTDYLLWKKTQIDTFFLKKKINRECKYYKRERLDTRTQKTYKSNSILLFWAIYIRFLYKKAYYIKDNKLHKNVEWLLRNISSDKHIAIWFMDDGSESRSKAKHITGEVYFKNPYFRLAAYSFTLGECQLIKQWFTSKYKITPSINMYKHGPILQFSVADSKKLFPHIRPYIVQTESMKTKFRLCLERY